MSATRTKCLTGSALFHAALASGLVLIPAFSPPPPPDDRVELRLVNVIPERIIDSAFAGGGGSPAAQPTPPPLKPDVPKPEPPRPEPLRPEPPKPLPPKPEVTPAAVPPKVDLRRQPVPTPKTQESPTPPPDATAKPTVSTTRKIEVARSLSKPTAAEVEAERAERRAQEQQRREYAAAREAAERRQREVQQQLSSAADELRKGASSLDRRLTGTRIDMPAGAGGEAYINYHSVLYSIYKPRWDRGRPDAIVEGFAAVKSAVTVARDGTVVSTRVVQPSGIPAVDKAAERVLKAVTFIAPFPAGTTDAQRTFTINFTVEGRTDL